MDASVEVFDVLAAIPDMPPLNWPNLTDTRAVPRLIVQRAAQNKRRLGTSPSFEITETFVVTVIEDSGSSDEVSNRVLGVLENTLFPDRDLGDFKVKDPPTMAGPFYTSGEWNTPIRFSVRGYSAT